MEYLRPLKEQVYSCLRCGICRGDCVIESSGIYEAFCPIYLVKPHDVFTPRGKLMLARAYLEGKTPPEQLIDYVFACTNCNNCTLHCPLAQIPRVDYKTKQVTEARLLDPAKIVEAFKAELFSKGFYPKGLNTLLESGKEKHNVCFEPHEERFSWLPREVKESLPKQAKYVYFVGCLSSYRFTNIAKATVEILEKLDVDYTLIDEWCCGSSFWRIGDFKTAEEMAMHNLKEISRAGAEYVIVSCADCYRALKKDYAEKLKEDLDIKVLHISELLQSFVKENKVKLKKVESVLRVAYHDPCSAAKHVDLYHPPRELLKAIPGIELFEMLHNKKGSFCCGAGGGITYAYPDVALKLSSMRIQEALNIGVKQVISICPLCESSLSKASEALGKPIEVLDLVEVLNQRLERT